MDSKNMLWITNKNEINKGELSILYHINCTLCLKPRFLHMTLTIAQQRGG